MNGALVRHAPRGPEIRRWGTRWRTFVHAIAVSMIAVSLSIIGLHIAASPALMQRTTPAEQTKRFLHRLAFEAFPVWQQSQGDTSCPTIRDLLVWTDLPRDHVRDAWGQPIEIRCGEPLPGSVHGLFLRSAGPDGEFGTDDDVTL